MRICVEKWRQRLQRLLQGVQPARTSSLAPSIKVVNEEAMPKPERDRAADSAGVARCLVSSHSAHDVYVRAMR